MEFCYYSNSTLKNPQGLFFSLTLCYNGISYMRGANARGYGFRARRFFLWNS